MKYRIYLINFGYYAQPEFNTFKDAAAYAKTLGFESRVEFAKDILAFVSANGGLQYRAIQNHSLHRG